MRRKKKLKKYPLIIICIIIILIIACILLLNPINSVEKKASTNIIGTWTTDNVTKYKFNKDNTGKLITSLNSYEFTYEIKDDSLSIDFKNEKSEDSKYTYKFENDKLILEGNNGKFTFTKLEDKKS